MEFQQTRCNAATGIRGRSWRRSMLKNLKTAAGLALLALCSAASVIADVTPALPVIDSTEVDNSLQQITIAGDNFGTVAPGVWLNNVPLKLITYTNTEVTAFLPKNLAAGDYLLAVSNTKSKLFGFFMATVGAVGPQGPAGPIGK